MLLVGLYLAPVKIREFSLLETLSYVIRIVMPLIGYVIYFSDSVQYFPRLMLRDDAHSLIGDEPQNGVHLSIWRLIMFVLGNCWFG